MFARVLIFGGTTDLCPRLCELFTPHFIVDPELHDIGQLALKNLNPVSSCNRDAVDLRSSSADCLDFIRVCGRPLCELFDIGSCDSKLVVCGFGVRSNLAEFLLEGELLRVDLFALSHGGIQFVQRHLQPRKQRIPVESRRSELLANGKDLVGSLGDECSIGVSLDRSVALLLILVLDRNAHREVELQQSDSRLVLPECRLKLGDAVREASGHADAGSGSKEYLPVV